MRAVVQRVREAWVTVSGRAVARIGPGLLVLLGVGLGDTDEDATHLAEKVVHLRIFADDAGQLNRSLSVAEGIFQANMDVTLVNQGPVTILLDSGKNF